jgi:hypothetical protein
MILSASRRCDLPAERADWLMEGFRAGFFDWSNPYDPYQKARIDARPEALDCVVFWTKDASAMLRHLPELEERGYRSIFQCTANAYPPPVELIDHARAEEALIAMREAIGTARVRWRYDPIILSDASPPEWHLEAFGRLARRLGAPGMTVHASFYDSYPAADARMRSLADSSGRSWTPRADMDAEIPALAASMRSIAEGLGMRLVGCVETSLAPILKPGACVDAALIEALWGIEGLKRDRGQRKGCLCAASKDIGSYGSCRMGCAYCYARRNGRSLEKPRSGSSSAASP